MKSNFKSFLSRKESKNVPEEFNSKEIFLKSSPEQSKASTFVSRSSSNFLMGKTKMSAPGLDNPSSSNFFCSFKLQIPDTTKSTSEFSVGFPYSTLQNDSVPRLIKLKEFQEYASLRKPDGFAGLFSKTTSSRRIEPQDLLPVQNANFLTEERTQTQNKKSFLEVPKSRNESKNNLSIRANTERLSTDPTTSSIRRHLKALSKTPRHIPKNALSNLCIDDLNMHTSNPISSKSAQKILFDLESKSNVSSLAAIAQDASLPNHPSIRFSLRKNSLNRTKIISTSPKHDIIKRNSRVVTEYLSKHHNASFLVNPYSRSRFSLYRMPQRELESKNSFGNQSKEFPAMLLQKYHLLTGTIKKQLTLLYLNENTNENTKIIDEIAKGNPFLMGLKKYITKDKYLQFQMDFTILNSKTLSALEYFSRNMHAHLFARREKSAKQLKQELVKLSRHTLMRKNEIANAFYTDAMHFLEFTKEMNQVEGHLFGFHRGETVPKKIRNFEEAVGKLNHLSSDERKLQDLYQEIYEGIDECRSQLAEEKLF